MPHDRVGFGGAEGDIVRQNLLQQHRPGPRGLGGWVYQLSDGEIVGIKGAGGLSRADADAKIRAIGVQFGLGWFRNITADMFT